MNPARPHLGISFFPKNAEFVTFDFWTLGLWDFWTFGLLDFGTWHFLTTQNAKGNFLTIENAESNV